MNRTTAIPVRFSEASSFWLLGRTVRKSIATYSTLAVHICLRWGQASPLDDSDDTGTDGIWKDLPNLNQKSQVRRKRDNLIRNALQAGCCTGCCTDRGTNA